MRFVHTITLPMGDAPSAMTFDPDQLEARLMSHGVYVMSLDADEERIEIEYESIKAGNTGAVPHREIGRVINVVRDLAEKQRDVRGEVTDLDGDRVGNWRAKAEWFRELEEDELSEVDFSERVIESIREE
ncbi:hypothetical protein SAMN05421858_2781 [Haladaptatus litoreus]|uniref:DUF8159 domain-containing protein n=2 Tax=Haladaptatus litoreus TaxID=553468 RepID=A0A1N7BV78_9EURY|nr:hypothetical protein SAMN05421858_2781 [Haladaptatus litoreus]